jgi:hypothetical protein
VTVDGFYRIKPAGIAEQFRSPIFHEFLIDVNVSELFVLQVHTYHFKPIVPP